MDEAARSDRPNLVQREFTWRDAERTILFAAGLLAGAAETLRERGWERYELVTTSRALRSAPAALTENATAVHELPRGQVPNVSAVLLDEVELADLVALGGGRVIDSAKAVAAVRGGRVCAVPTTLSGAEMTTIHRLPEGASAPRLVRPELVLADPEQMTGQPEAQMRASAMNALAHGADSLYTPLANPLSRLAALRGAALIAAALDEAPARRDSASLALGSLLAAHALDSALFALHHVICQTLVRVLEIPHAETNAALLPHTMEAMRPRAGEEIAALGEAIGAPESAIGGRIAELAGGAIRLESLGAERPRIEEAIAAILARGELQMTPQPPEEAELRRIVEAAW